MLMLIFFFGVVVLQRQEREKRKNCRHPLCGKVKGGSQSCFSLESVDFDKQLVVGWRRRNSQTPIV